MCMVCVFLQNFVESFSRKFKRSRDLEMKLCLTISALLLYLLDSMCTVIGQF